MNIGIGFQLKDDLLDAYADPKKFGKQVGGDILANKKTILLIHALAKAKGRDAKELSQWLSLKKFKKAEKVKAVKRIYDSVGVQKTVEKKINSYFDKGFKSLDAIASSPQKEFLVQFTRSLIEREV